MHYHISLKVPYIKTICIDGVEYINIDYKPSSTIKLNVSYIESLKIKGKLYKNLDYDNKTKNEPGS